MNPKVVIMLAKQVQECQKKSPIGNQNTNKLGVKIIVNETDISDVQA
jgi:hypothetical protein